MRPRQAAAAVLPLVLLCACGSGSPTAAPQPTVPPVTTTAGSPEATSTGSPSSAMSPTSTSPSASTTPDITKSTTAPTTRPPSPSATAPCLTASLAITDDGGAKSSDSPDFVGKLTFRNTSDTACRLDGFPGVAVAGQDGKTVNGTRKGTASPVTLAPGGRAQARYEVTTGTSGSSLCKGATTALVTPPGQTKSVTVSATGLDEVGAACASAFEIDPVAVVGS